MDETAESPSNPPLLLRNYRDLIYSCLSYQYSVIFAETFFQLFPQISLKFSTRTKKIKYVLEKDLILLSYKAQTGTFLCNPEIIPKILQNIPPPRFRVKILKEVTSFIEAGKSVFAKHVITADPELRPGDEVFVVDETDRFLALGKLNLPISQLSAFSTGVAVKVRHGIRSASKLSLRALKDDDD